LSLWCWNDVAFFIMELKLAVPCFMSTLSFVPWVISFYVSVFLERFFSRISYLYGSVFIDN